jgi:hypothetical protein
MSTLKAYRLGYCAGELGYVPGICCIRLPNAMPPNYRSFKHCRAWQDGWHYGARAARQLDPVWTGKQRQWERERVAADAAAKARGETSQCTA